MYYKWFKYLIVFFALFIPTLSRSQVSISYPASAEAIQKGMSSSYLYVKINFSTNCTTNLVEIRLPFNTEYIPGSLDSLSGKLSVTEYQIGDLRKPVFEISNSTANSNATFRIKRRAICSSNTSGKDSVYVTSTCGTFLENTGNTNTYSLFQPVLSFSGVPAITGGLIGKNYTRSIQVTNGGQGCLDTFRYYVVNSDKQISYTEDLSFNNVSFKPYKTNGDTLFYKIFGNTVFNGKSSLCNGEKVVIKEELKILKCIGKLDYAAYWGPGNQKICNTSRAVGNIYMATGVGSFSNISVNLDNNYVDMCGTNNNGYVDFVARYNWTGQGNDTAGGAYNVELKLGNNINTTILGALPTTIFSDIDSVTINGNSVPCTYQGGILTIKLKDYFSTDPDGAGGLMDLDGDGYYDDLKLNSFILIKFKVKLNCNLTCNASKITAFSGILNYSKMCDSSMITSNAINSGRALREHQWNENGYIPSNITPGQTFRVRLSTGTANNANYFRTNQTRFQWELVLPKGFSVAGTGNVKWFNGFYYSVSNPVNRTYTKSGDTIFVISPGSTPGWVELDLVYNCDNYYTDIFNLNYKLVQINNISTGCECLGQMSCGTLSTKAYCDNNCKTGPVSGIPKVMRSENSIGWTDRSLNTRQNRTNISDYDLSKALFLDTIEIASYAIQQDSSTNLKIRFELPKANSSTNKLTPLDVQYFYYRNNSLIRSGIDTVFSSTATTNTIQKIDWDLTNTIPNSQLLPLDSIVTITRYVVSTETLPLYDVQSGGDWYYYNQNVQNNTQVFCNKRIAEMYLVGTNRLNATNVHNTYACTPVGLGGWTNYLARRFASNGIQFNNEFRPGLYIDSIKVVIPAGYVFNTANYYQSNTYNENLFILYDVKPDKIVNNTYIFYNKGDFAPLDITVTNNYGAYFQVVVTPKCSTLPKEDIITHLFAKDYYYKFAKDSIYPSNYRGNIFFAQREINHYNKGDIDLISNIQNKLATKNNESLSLRILNKSNGSTPFIWGKVALNNKIKVDSVYLVNPKRKLDIINLGDGVWFKIDSTGISPGQFLDVEIFTNFNACFADSLKVYAGWDCNEYTTDPNTDFCGLDSVWLKIVPDKSEIQLSFLPHTKSKFELCSLDTLKLEYNNANAAYVYNPSIVIDLPFGISIPDSVMIEYPAGSNNYYKTMATVANGKATISLADHTLIGTNGIPGLADANNTNERSPKILVPISISCDFLSGLSVKANAYGITPCGAPVIGNGILAISSNLDLEGINFAGEVKLETKLNSDKIRCGNELIVSTKITPYFFNFSQGDTLVYTVSKVMTPADSFFTKTGNCATCNYKLEKDKNGDWLVKVTMDTTVVVDSFSAFDIKFKPNEADTGNFVVEGYFKRNVPPLKCKEVYCENTSVILKKYFSDSVRVTNPPSFADFTFTVTDSCERQNEYNFKNTSTTLSAFASNYLWDFGDSTSSNGKDSVTKVYTKKGIYDVKLTMINDNGCFDSAMQTVQVYPMPAGNFMVNITGQCLLGNDFEFTNLSNISDSTSLEYYWDFGNGDTSQQNSPGNVFTNSGTYKIALVSVSDKGCRDTFSRIIDVFPMPVAAFDVNNSGQCLFGNKFDFTTNSNIPGSGSLNHLWNFGNNDTSIVSSPSYSFGKEGMYTVQLIVSSAENCRDTITDIVEVFTMPEAGFENLNPGQCLLGNSFSFDNKSSISNAGDLNYYWDFDNGDTSQQVSPVYSYATYGTYSVKLIAESEKFCMDTSILNIEVYPMPMAGFTINDSGQCLFGNNFIFNNNSTISNATALNSIWNFGDADTSQQGSPSHSFAGHGDYQVVLEMISEKGCKDTTNSWVQVFPMPVAVFEINDTGQCYLGNYFEFTDKSNINDSGALGQHEWHFGNGDTSQQVSPEYTYSTFGNYSVQLNLFSDRGCSDTAILQTTVFPMPVADFDADVSAQCLLGNSFVFDNKTTISDSTNLSCFWDFGDINTSTDFEPQHGYADYGTFDVEMIAQSLNLCADTVSKKVEVFPMPVAEYTISDTALCLLGNEFTFNNLSTIPYNSISSFWDFGNSDTIQTDAPVYAYSMHGKYDVRLIVLSENNCADTSIHSLEVHPMPVANFTMNDSAMCLLGNEFVFSNSTSIPYTNLSYKWDLGNADSSVLESITYSYPVRGVYVVSLISTSEYNCSDTIYKNMEVYPMPLADFSMSDSALCLLGNNFTFTNNSTIEYNTLSYAWDFGNGDVSNLQSPGYSYPDHGKYLVRLISLSEYSCADTLNRNLEVFPMPIASYTVPDSTLCQTESEFDFTNLSSIPYGTIVRNLWDFGNGDSIESLKPKYKYALLGEYTVRLIVESDRGCYDTFSRIMGVYDNPKALFKVDTVCLNEPTQFSSISTSVDGIITNYRWKLEDGFTSTDSDFSHPFKKPGTYDVSLEVETAYGCKDMLSQIDMAVVYTLPLVDFEFVKLLDSLRISGYQFSNLSSGEEPFTYTWYFDNFGLSNEENPYFEFSDTGNMLVKLETTDYFGCLNSNEKTIRIIPDLQVFIPTAFSPNRDRLNETFKPEGKPYVEDYLFEIFNRWGELLFSTRDYNIGWDGTYKGLPVFEGVYVYKITINDMFERRVIKNGMFTLLR